MTLLFDGDRRIKSPALAPAGGDRRARDPIELTIGLVNNMPDSALKATDVQIARLLQQAAPWHVRIRLHCFSLPSIARSPMASSHVAQTYTDIDRLDGLDIDGLIVTGAEPVAARLRDESYWPDLAAIVDWARTNTKTTIWSCLAAHAAVLHLDDIERQRLASKCSGVFDCVKVRDDWLTHGIDAPLQVPHSRLNAVNEPLLAERGYDILTRSAEVGVDIFARTMPSRFVFFQGHPEYDALSLQREYMRDIARYLAGQREDYPRPPRSYFSAESEAVLNTFEIRARARRDPTLAAELPGLTLRPDLAAGHAAKLLFRNWIGYLADG
ncbi:Homoserine O-succinyltransferase (Homoserine O-transsuccinylase) (HTS) [Bradyrhizobium sp. ORS 278]|uniref:Homoserine O-succinyltransferase n=1 Tax=Bradyrhizobium japonicum TaxID=375 RepID=METAS_BRAJP|nr:homoserine O-succinyltransferase [Bradyrhizobium sp. ORS 278]A0A1D3PCJ5.1 RecName: Full=Homoserine O-succinyltransferase; Short=HST; AltName: Full=Homoserine transsuccinylase; Short=HTS [Bradyrhizobium japonicum]CAL80503.1 Homoserine O-succinyltransferase (Homoserine O-transsuccinylase) (HTS) [Bradyrhizobium sp. ORS 278]SCN13861.1 Homoserine O-succinyltransferase [Bradyrhizobium japonicum]